MKEKVIQIRADEEFIEKVEYIKRINDYKNSSDAIRRTIEKEYRKEREDCRVDAIDELIEYLTPCASCDMYSKCDLEYFLNNCKAEDSITFKEIRAKAEQFKRTRS